MPSLQPVWLTHYRYDALDRLINDEHPDTPARQRFYCQKRLVTEIQGALGQSIVQHGDLLLAQQRRQGQSADTALLATDQQRSVLQTLDRDQPPQPIAYSPYGHHRGESGLSGLLGFNGERPDPVTGHYLLGQGYRAYNPVLMRFNCPDSWSPFGRGGLNAYGYCVGNPVNRVDPTGHVIANTGQVNSYRVPKVARVIGITPVTAPVHKSSGDVFGEIATTYQHIGWASGKTSELKNFGQSFAAKMLKARLKVEVDEGVAKFNHALNSEGGEGLELHKVYINVEHVSSLKGFQGTKPLRYKSDLKSSGRPSLEIPSELSDELLFSQQFIEREYYRNPPLKGHVKRTIDMYARVNELVRKETPVSQSRKDSI